WCQARGQSPWGPPSPRTPETVLRDTLCNKALLVPCRVLLAVNRHDSYGLEESFASQVAEIDLGCAPHRDVVETGVPDQPDRPFLRRQIVLVPLAGCFIEAHAELGAALRVGEPHVHVAAIQAGGQHGHVFLRPEA